MYARHYDLSPKGDGELRPSVRGNTSPQHYGAVGRAPSPRDVEGGWGVCDVDGGGTGAGTGGAGAGTGGAGGTVGGGVGGGGEKKDAATLLMWSLNAWYKGQQQSESQAMAGAKRKLQRLKTRTKVSL